MSSFELARQLIRRTTVQVVDVTVSGFGSMDTGPARIAIVTGGQVTGSGLDRNWLDDLDTKINVSLAGVMVESSRGIVSMHTLKPGDTVSITSGELIMVVDYVSNTFSGVTGLDSDGVLGLLTYGVGSDGKPAVDFFQYFTVTGDYRSGPEDLLG